MRQLMTSSGLVVTWFGCRHDKFSLNQVRAYEEILNKKYRFKKAMKCMFANGCSSNFQTLFYAKTPIVPQMQQTQQASS